MKATNYTTINLSTLGCTVGLYHQSQSTLSELLSFKMQRQNRAQIDHSICAFCGLFKLCNFQ